MIKKIFIVCLVFNIACCLAWAEDNLSKQGLQNQTMASDKERQQEKGNNSIGGRKYRSPSIMIERDMFSRVVNGEEQDGLLLSLVVKKWRLINDKYGRQCKYISPEITYAELQDRLNFNDEDVTVNKDRKPDEPHAFIKTPWLTCNITYLGKVYDGKDKSVKLKAVVIDNKEQAESDAHAEYDKNKGIVKTILDFFSTSPHDR